MVSSPFQIAANQQKEKIKNPQGSPFDQAAKEQGITEEPWWKSAARTALQIPQGILEGTTYGITTGLGALGALGETDLDVEEWNKLRGLYAEKGIDFDEAFERGREEMLQTIPTISNIARKVEEKTGLPLEPKTRLQKGLRFGSMAGKISPGTLAQKGTAAVTSVGTSEGLQEAGVPESLAELVALPVGLGVGTKAPKIDIGKSKKPSGMTERRYEKLEKPVQVSEKKIRKINEKVENEFRDIASDIISKSPIEETYSALKKDSGFKQAAEEGFEKVNELAENIPETFSTKDIKKNLVDRVLKDKGTGFLPSEYDLSHKKFINQAIKNTPTQDISATDLIKQYRKNNKAFGELREPGQSSAYNRGKKQALMDYNKTIASMIEEKFPDSEFSNLFKSTNKKWQEIMDVEAIDGFMNDLFEGKVQFKEGQKLLEKQGMQFPFKRALGEQGYKDFNQLLKDLMTTQKGQSMMKVAQSKGFEKLAKTGLSFILHPKLGYAKAIYEGGKAGYKKIWESLLDKPQLAVTWDKGVKAFKKGDFATAEKAFETLEKESKTVKPEILPKKEISLKEKPSETMEAKVEPVRKTETKIFQTEKGSSYIVNEDGTTTRNKAYRPEHGKKEQGLQPKSEKTWFVSKEDANKLGEFQAKGQDKRIIELPDGRLGIIYESGKDAGKVEARTIITPNKEPKEGLIPVESWEGGKKIHFGNKITKIEKPSVSINESKLKEIKRQDISKKGLKEQKIHLINELDKAIESLEKNPNQPREKITFDVPGDDQFKIYNDLKALKQFKNDVKKRWPDAPLRMNPPTKTREYPKILR